MRKTGMAMKELVISLGIPLRVKRCNTAFQCTCTDKLTLMKTLTYVPPRSLCNINIIDLHYTYYMYGWLKRMIVGLFYECKIMCTQNIFLETVHSIECLNTGDDTLQGGNSYILYSKCHINKVLSQSCGTCYM